MLRPTFHAVRTPAVSLLILVALEEDVHRFALPFEAFGQLDELVPATGIVSGHHSDDTAQVHALIIYTVFSTDGSTLALVEMVLVL